jgi:hypothetical protein
MLCFVRWISSVGIVTRIRTGRPGLNSRQGRGKLYFLFATASIPTLESIQIPIQYEPGAFYPRIKRPMCEGDHLPPSCVVVKNLRSHKSISPILKSIVLN